MLQLQQFKQPFKTIFIATCNLKQLSEPLAPDFHLVALSMFT